MSLQILVPPTCEREARYCIHVLFGEWMNLDHRVRVHSGPGIVIARGGKRIELDASFFQEAESAWLHRRTLPTPPARSIEISEIPPAISNRVPARTATRTLPVLFGSPTIGVSDRVIKCGVDVIGTAFVMLSRYEEAVIGERDEHGRFSASSSIAAREGVLHRPVVNEYLDLLWAMIQTLWPGMRRPLRRFRVLPSHDVDVPFHDLGLPALLALRRAAGDVVKRWDVRASIDNLIQWWRVNRRDASLDLYDTFDFIMQESELRGLRSSFFFLPFSSSDLSYQITLDSPWMVDLVDRIAARGHEIGLHFSYDSFMDDELSKREAHRVGLARREAGLPDQPVASRHHYLRWQTPETIRVLESAGVAVDSTLGYADSPGFRCGTCWEYPLYDVGRRVGSSVVERPLVVMEQSVIGKRYLDLGLGTEAHRTVARLKAECHAHAGDFTLLWHNSELETDEKRSMYTALLDA